MVIVTATEGRTVTDGPRQVFGDDGEDDAALLRRKAASHAAHGWEVTTTPSGFRATKDRHGGRRNVRIFEVR